MARHKKMVTEEQEDPALDISSLIDVCFLLLIYFIVATSLVQEKKLDMAMPGNSTAGQAPELDPAFIKVDAAGVVYWGNGPSQMVMDSDPNHHELPTLFEKLNNLRETADGMGTKPIVQLFVEGGAKNQRMVDVLNALTKAKIKTVGLSNVRED